jgi:hypothetical protein
MFSGRLNFFIFQLLVVQNQTFKDQNSLFISSVRRSCGSLYHCISQELKTTLHPNIIACLTYIWFKTKSWLNCSFLQIDFFENVCKYADRRHDFNSVYNLHIVVWLSSDCERVGAAIQWKSFKINLNFVFWNNFIDTRGKLLKKTQYWRRFLLLLSCWYEISSPSNPIYQKVLCTIIKGNRKLIKF